MTLRARIRSLTRRLAGHRPPGAGDALAAFAESILTAAGPEDHAPPSPSPPSRPKADNNGHPPPKPLE